MQCNSLSHPPAKCLLLLSLSLFWGMHRHHHVSRRRSLGFIQENELNNVDPIDTAESDETSLDTYTTGHRWPSMSSVFKRPLTFRPPFPAFACPTRWFLDRHLFYARVPKPSNGEPLVVLSQRRTETNTTEAQRRCVDISYNKLGGLSNERPVLLVGRSSLMMDTKHAPERCD